MKKNHFHDPSEAQKKINQILLKDWDPIGIGHSPEVQDEYETYVQQIFDMLERSADVHEIAAFLTSLEVKRMGIERQRALTDNLVVAEKLRSLLP